jgi:hypothetical protein
MIALLAAIALQAADVAVAEESPQLAMSASWPADAAAIAPLDAALRADLRRRGRDATAFARRIEGQVRRERFPFVQHALVIQWRIEGSTPQLISLSALVSATQGGGHSSDTYDALLWDRLADRPVAIGTMLDMPALEPRFCAAHASAGRPNEEGCPTLAGRTIAPADSDGNGRFDAWRVLVAVNYFEAEGYSVDIPIEPDDIARLPAGDRPAFEVPGER